MMVELCYALGRRHALEEELQKHASIEQPIIESPLWRRALPAIGLGGLLAAAGMASGRAAIDQDSIKGPLGGLLPPTPTQVDIEKNWRGGQGALIGAALGSGLGALAPEWLPFLTRSTKTVGSALL